MVTFVVDIEWDRVKVDLVWNQSWQLSMAVVNLACWLVWWSWLLSLLFVSCIVLGFSLNPSECLWIHGWILIWVRCGYWYSSQLRITLFFRNRLAQIPFRLNIGCITVTTWDFWISFTWTASQQRAVVGLVVLNWNCLVFEWHLILEVLRSVVVVIVEAIDWEFRRVGIPSLLINVLADILGVQIRSDVLAVWWLIQADHINGFIRTFSFRLLEGWKNLIVAITWVEI